MAVTSAINPTTLSTPAAGTATAKGGSTEIAGNFQSFLLLLTTQLKNQSPLDPLDTNQFTQQLVQFASVEQQLKTNASLATMVAGAKASSAAAAAGLVGAKITADGSTTNFADGAATWTVNAAKATPAATVTISDSTGLVVATQTRPLNAGSQTVTWDGRLANGEKAQAGSYKIGIAARDAAGQPTDVTAEVKGTVSSVDMSGESPVLLVGTARIPMSSVKAIGG